MNTDNEPRSSAAGIRITKKSSSSYPGRQLDDPAPRLRALIAECGTNKHDQAIAAITGCITEGINTGVAIVNMLARLGFKPQHAGMTLAAGEGAVPERHRWTKNANGRYSLLE